MTNFFVCIACLSSDIKMCSIENTKLPEIYEKYTNTQLFIDNGIPRTMCYICYSQLQKLYRFMNMAQKAGKILTQLLSDGIQLSEATVSALVERTSNSFVTTILKSTSATSLYIYDEKSVEASSSNNVYDEEINTTDTTVMEDCVKEPQVVITVKEEPKDIAVQMTMEKEVVEIKKEHMDVGAELITKVECTSVKEESMKVKKEKEKKLKYKCALQSQIIGNKMGLPEGDNQNINYENLHNMPKRKYTKKKNKDSNSHEKNHLCNNCQMKFSCKAYLMRHIRIHTGEKPYACKSCDKTFAQNGHLIQHMRLHTGEKPYACHICKNKAFNHRYNYKTHMRKHFGVPSHKCDLCSSAFHQKGDLKRHIMTHTGEKPFACTTCNMRFSQNCHLTKHAKLHLGKLYACTHCKQEFTQKLDLNNHLTTMHTGQKLFPCTNQGCFKSFNRKGMLTNHMKAHTEERPYACDKCNKTFKQKGHFTKHNVMVHSKTQSDLLKPNKTNLLLNQVDLKLSQKLQNHEQMNNQNNLLQDQKHLQKHVDEYIIP